jgi:hypothetical protein
MIVKEDEAVDMEMTMCVGGIIPDPLEQGTHLKLVQSCSLILFLL